MVLGNWKFQKDLECLPKNLAWKKKKKEINFLI